MSQVNAHNIVNRIWDFLEPSRNPDWARTDHIKLVSAIAGTKIVYSIGQVVRQKNDGTNEFAKQGTAGYTGPVRVMKYPHIVDESGNYQLGDVWYDQAAEVFTGTVDAYWRGVFRTQDLILQGTSFANEVQTETVTATGGSRKYIVSTAVGDNLQTTTAVAFNATAVTIQASLEALDNVLPGDIVVTGTGPYVFTFGGQYAGRNVAMIGLDTSLLTGGSSSFAETTPGVASFTTIGRLIRGSAALGEIEIGV